MNDTLAGASPVDQPVGRPGPKRYEGGRIKGGCSLHDAEKPELCQALTGCVAPHFGVKAATAPTSVEMIVGAVQAIAPRRRPSSMPNADQSNAAAHPDSTCPYSNLILFGGFRSLKSSSVGSSRSTWRPVA